MILWGGSHEGKAALASARAAGSHLPLDDMEYAWVVGQNVTVPAWLGTEVGRTGSEPNGAAFHLAPGWREWADQDMWEPTSTVPRKVHLACWKYAGISGAAVPR